MAKTTKKHNKFIALRIENSLFTQIKNIAEKNGLSFSETVRLILRHGLQKDEIKINLKPELKTDLKSDSKNNHLSKQTNFV